MKFAKYIYLRFNREDKLIDSLLISVMVGLVLLITRIIYNHQLTLVFLVWNLILAFIPLFISRAARSIGVFQKPGPILIPAFFLWLIFFPNAPYILTDFYHLKQADNVPFWFDMIIIALFAWNGLMIGFITLKDMQHIVSRNYSQKAGWICTTTAILLGSFGIYIGRFLRYNSWDIFLVPFSLGSDIFKIFICPLQHKAAYGMTIVLTLFLFTSYYNFSRFTEAHKT